MTVFYILQILWDVGYHLLILVIFEDAVVNFLHIIEDH